MTPEIHPGLDELILYCMGTPQAEGDAATNDQLRSHVEGCAECQAQVRRLLSDLSLVAQAVPQIAPPALAKDRLMRVAGADLVRSGTGPDAASATTPAKNGASDKVVPMKPRRHSPGLIWGGWVAAAACLFYAVQLREANQGMRQQLRTETSELISANSAAESAAHAQDVRATQTARAEEILEVLTSPQAQRVTLISAHAKPEPTGHAVYLRERGALVFTASNLRPLPPNKTYELWVIPANGTAPVPAGTFQPNTRGMASVLLPKLPPGIKAKAFGVTMENAGGATIPTLPILLAGG